MLEFVRTVVSGTDIVKSGHGLGSHRERPRGQHAGVACDVGWISAEMAAAADCAWISSCPMSVPDTTVGTTVDTTVSQLASLRIALELVSTF